MKLIATFLLLLTTCALADEPQPVELFNGKELAGWTLAGPGSFEVKDGALHTVGGMGLLYYEKELGDFTLSLEFKVSRREDNSGVFIRFSDTGGDPWKAVMDGEEIQIHDAGTKMSTGGIYNAQPAKELASKPVGEWNTMEIAVSGRKITVKINDKVVNEYESRKFGLRGYIGLQNHDDLSKVSFRNIRLIEPEPPSKAVKVPAPKPIDTARAAGLVGKYFKDTASFEALAKAGAPFLVRVDPAIEFPLNEGQFHRTKLASKFAARWDGYLRVKETGEYQLALRSDEPSRLFIGDQLVIDNLRPAMRQAKSALVALSPGDYPARVEYYNQQRGGGILFAPKQLTLVHDAEQAKVKWDEAAWKNATWSYRAWLDIADEPWAKMDYGSFVSHTIELAKDNHALKGIAIRLGDRDEATVVFDTTTCRFVGGWTGGFLQLTGIAFDGSQGTNPTPDGEMFFSTPATSQPARAKYKGLHVNGRRVVLHYTIDDVDVLDSPWVKTTNGKTQIVRSVKTTAALNSGDANMPATISAEGVDALMKPAAPRWAEPVVTKGEVAATTQPYAVDTIVLPAANPWNAWMRPAALDFFADGRAVVTTLSGDVWIVSGIDEKLEKITWKRFATGLFQPLGVKVVDETIHVLGRDQITRLKDANGDGEADEYENFNNDCIVSRSPNEFAVDLQTDAAGNFYFAKCAPLAPGGRGWDEITPHNGTVLRVSKDGGKLDVFATGVLSPGGVGVGPAGEISISDRQGMWSPTGRLSFIKEGDFLNVADMSKRAKPPADFPRPICWLPIEADGSPGGQVWVTTDKWGPFQNRMLHTSAGKGVLFLVMGGGVVKFPQLKFTGGISRARFNPKDNQLYVVGQRTFQRVRYTGGAVKMPSELQVNHDGVSITFTTPLDESIARDIANYAIEQWNYRWSADFGSADYKVSKADERGRDAVPVKAAALSADGKTISLKLDRVSVVMQMRIALNLKSKDGSPMEFVIYNTINEVPKPPATAPATTTAARR
jgi:hypothetical protein